MRVGLFNRRLLRAVSFAALATGVGAAPVLAQEGEASRGGLDTIVVTATYKEQSLQDTSIAIDAIDGDKLNELGVTSAADLTRLVPALSIQDGGGIQSNIFMRGIGNRSNNSYIDPAITINYDGVAMAQGSSTSLAAFYDLERVEVLKGPQGTLYGKNATGGVINIIPAEPKLGEVEAIANAGYGNYDAIHFDGALNLPLGDSAAFRIAGSINKRDGYYKDGQNDDNRKSIRGQFLFEPSDTLSIRIAGDYTDVGGNGAGTTAVGSYAPMGLGTYQFIPSGLAPNEGSNTDIGNAYRQTLLAAPGFGFLTPIQDDWYVDGKLYGFNAELNWSTDFGTLTIVPAYRKTKQDSRFGQPGFNSGWWRNDAEQISIEARFAGDLGERIDYIVGAWYLDEEQNGNNTFNQEFVLPLQDFTQDTTSWAVFGEATFSITDTTRFIGGVRYTDDSKDLVGGINNFITFCGGPPPALVTPPGSFAQGCAAPNGLPRFPTLDTVDEAYDFLFSNGWASMAIPIPPGFLIPLDNGVGKILHAVSNTNSSYEDNAVSYRFVLEQDLFDDSLLYASFSKGYRSGGLEPATFASYDPEYLNAYTIGMKNRLLNGNVQLNIELFYWDYKDQQISYFHLAENNVLENTTQNVGKSVNKGVDVDVLWLLTENTLLTTKVQYLDAKYKDLHFYTSPPRDNVNCPFTVTGFADGVPLLDFDCSNNTSVYSPKWVVMAGIEQTIPMNNGFQVVASVNSTWTDDQLTGFNNLAYEVIEEHFRTDASLTLESQEENWYIRLWARNLEDKHRVQSTQAPLLGAGFTKFSIDATYGVDVGVRF